MLRVKDSISGNTSTATTLQNARTINGTNFDGSANIITSNWGTARTLTIGNTGKSVNGNSNITWNLSEIGAASTSIATTSTSGLMSYADKTKLDGIATGANNYVHPGSGTNPHSTTKADVGLGNVNNWGATTAINSTSTTTYATASAVKQAYDLAASKANASHGNHVPTTQTANNAVFLRNDNTWQTVTPANIGAALSYHTHNFLDVKGTNTISSTTNDITSNWGGHGNSIHFYTTANCIKNQPSQWGFLLNIGQGAEVHQIWMEQATGSLFHRGGNGSGWNGSTSGNGAWKTLLDSSNYSNYAIPTSASCNKNWNWSGQGGQPTWVWGGNDGTNMYVYNPGNFSVSWATGAGYSNEWRSSTWSNCYLTTGNGDGASWSTHNTVFRSHWGIGFRDYTDACNFLIDTRTGNTFAKGYFMGTAFNTSSDRRLKENITPIDERLEKMFMELKPVNYYMLNQNDHRRHNGFIAQEIEEAMTNNNISYEEFAGLLKRSHKDEQTTEEDIPMQILNDENDKENTEYSLNYSEFTALNTHMIQKCLNIINDLSNRIQVLESSL